MAVQGFLSAFGKIDRDGDHIINHEDLRLYATENNMPDSFVQKWIRLFDANNTGKFTYEHFCEVIGLSKKTPTSPTEPPTPTVPKPTPPPNHEMKEYKCNMNDEMKKRVSSFIKENWKDADASGSIHETLIKCDNLYGPRWTSRTFEDETNIPKVEGLKGTEFAFSPDGGKHKYLVWRQKDKKAGGCCGCLC